MGINMLGGIIDGILGGLMDVFSTVITTILMPIINAVLSVVARFIIAPLVNVIISVISYFVGYFLYGICVFLLALVDYAELIFRLLAGLDVDGMRLTLDGGKDGSSDLLVQLLRSDVIQQAFLSMVIVGIFLLVITTIFQMIKVEYTTEGSKNAKGPILNKAFKGVATLMLLPILTIFGVFIGNQILGLIDTATKGGNNNGNQPTIAGTLFMTAASEAFYKPQDMKVRLTGLNPQVDLVLAVLPAAWNSITNAFSDVADSDYDTGYFDAPEQDGGTGESRDVVESGFICQDNGHKYYLLVDVTEYYDISRINYLLLLFGSGMVLKTLYYACFGMVVRLFHCGILFVVSPMIIGISPINDGAFKNWTKNFMGKAISAYGVVIAMNVFFIVVRVLLSLDVQFSSNLDYFFGAEMMVGLLKSIFVIGGCTMVEKFTKELGSYFGADDAVSAGKDLEKATKDSVKSAVKTAGTVALMASGAGGLASSAIGAIKSQGIAGALKSGAKSLGNTVLDKGQGIADTMGFGDKWEGMRGNIKDKAVDSKRRELHVESLEKIDDAKNRIAEDKIILNNARAGMYGGGIKSPEAIAAQKRINANNKLIRDERKRIDEGWKDDAELSALTKDRDDFNDDANVEMRAGARRNAISARDYRNSETIKNAGGWTAGFRDFAGQVGKDREAAAKLAGDQGASDLQGYSKQKSANAEAKYQKVHVDSIEASNIRMQNLQLNAISEGANKGSISANKALDGHIASYESAAKDYNDAWSTGDKVSQENAKARMASIQSNIEQLTGQELLVKNGTIQNKSDLYTSVTVNNNILQQIADKARNKGLSGDELTQYVMDALNKNGLGAGALQKIQEEIKKYIENLQK